MYSGVPMSMPICVNASRCADVWPRALATPKSMILGKGRPSRTQTRMFAGLRSRWISPLVWACCTASHTRAKSDSRTCNGVLCRSQYRVIGSPSMNSITK